jgi:hypothetical protein
VSGTSGGWVTTVGTQRGGDNPRPFALPLLKWEQVYSSNPSVIARGARQSHSLENPPRLLRRLHESELLAMTTGREIASADFASLAMTGWSVIPNDLTFVI